MSHIDSLLNDWYRFRETLSSVPDIREEVARYFLSKPRVKVYTDPYSRETWPTPWELITENIYCPFNIILGICYTLQLTDFCKNTTPEIHISIDINSKSVYYILVVDNFVFLDDEWIPLESLPTSLKTQKIFVMDTLH